MALPLVVRRNDFRLTDDERVFPGSVADYLAAACTHETVRAAEPLGFDARLWRALTGQGVVEAARGPDEDGTAGLVQGALIAEACGTYTAPVPYMETVAVARLLGRIDVVAATELGAEVTSGRKVVGFAPGSALSGWPQLIASGAIADAVIGLLGDDLVLLERQHEVPQVAVQGHLPAGWWGPGMASVTRLLAGDRARAAFSLARDEYLVLTGSALAGLGAASLDQAAGFARDRTTRGVPIGALQGVSHPLAECKVAIEGARQTARKAAWFCEHEPAADPKLPAVAFIAAARAADRACRVAMHVNGGMGVMVDGEPARYLLRSKSWAAVVARIPDVQLELANVLRSARYQDVVYPSML
jgi:alkylation response protein AidB-like acyl-CoA dehydrogenase